MRPHSVVHSVIYDDAADKATGVRVVDDLTKEITEFYARVIFVNAACLNSNLILLNSTSKRFPNGLGNDNGLLGKYIHFHNYRGLVNASYDGPEDKYYFGRRPTQPMMPNFRNVHKQDSDFQRGYMSFYGAGRGRADGSDTPGIGADFKKAITEPGGWFVSMGIQGETIPKITNEVRMSARSISRSRAIRAH